MNLSEKERRLITRLERREKTIHITYIFIGVIYSLALFGLTIGIQKKAKDGFLMAIYFGTIALYLTIGLRMQQKLLQIIKKLSE